MKISVSMITLNEEKNIARALSSCGFADEIVVVDGGSTDRTTDILKASDKVVLVHHPWENHFGRQRQVSLEHCAGDWVIRLDADEAFSKEFEEGIRDLLSSTPDGILGYRIRQCNLVGNERFYSKLADDYEATPRIWRSLQGIKWEGSVHEKLTGPNGIIRHWDVYVVHYGFLDRESYRQKGAFYSKLAGSGLQDPDRLYYREYDIQPRPQRSATAAHVPIYKQDDDAEGLPGIAIVRGPDLNEAEIRRYESLQDKFNMTLYSTGEATRPENIKLPVIKLISDPERETFMEGLEIALFDKDIIFAEDCSSIYSALAAVAKFKFGKKMIILESDETLSPAEDGMAKKLRKINRGFGDIFVATTERVKENLLLEGVPGERIVVIPMDDGPEEVARKFALLFENVFQSTFKGEVRELAEYMQLPVKDILRPACSDRFGQLVDLLQFDCGTPDYIKWSDGLFDFCSELNRERGGVRILDFGGGTGSRLIALSALKGAELDYAGKPGAAFDYAAWRFSRRRLGINMIDATTEGFLGNRMYDVLIAPDVPGYSDDHGAAVRYLTGHLNPGGYLVVSASSADNDGDPDAEGIFYNFVKSLEMQGVDEGCLPGYFRKPLEDPDDLKPQIYSAISDGRLADAKGLIDAHLEMHPADLDMLVGHARICIKLGDCRTAKDSIEKVLLFRPDMPEALEIAEMLRGREAKAAGNRRRRLNVLMASLSSPISSPFYYEKALRKICNVISFGPFRERTFWADFAGTLKSHFFYREGSIEHWTDICTRLSKPCDIVTQRGVIDIRDILRQLPSGFKPDIFLWIDQHGENLPVGLEHLDCPKVALFGDTHIGDINWRLKYALAYDYVYVMFNKQHIPRFEEAGCAKVMWSPAACDPEIHCRIISDKIYPVSFVGSTHPYLHHSRVMLLESLKRKNIDIFIDSKLLQEMSLIFSRSKMVLNKSLADDLNQRVFETLGTGSLLLTNRLGRDSGLEDLFRDRQHLVIYDNENDLIELIRYYLENPDEREAIALSGYKEALEKHTYDRRVEDIIRTVMEDVSHYPEADFLISRPPA